MSDVESATYWLSWLEFGGKLAVILVVIGVGYEFIEKRFGTPLHKVIEDARQRQIVELQNQNERLKHETAQLNADSVVMLHALQARQIVVLADADSPFWRLKTFDGTPILLQVLQTEEPRNFAKQFDLFKKIGFIIKPVDEARTHVPSTMLDGVTLFSWRPPASRDANTPIAAVQMGYDAAEALTKYLLLVGVDARHLSDPNIGKSSAFGFPSLPDNGVFVLVGARPVPLELTIKYTRELTERLEKEKQSTKPSP
jgi:hypothetical protein